MPAVEEAPKQSLAEVAQTSFEESRQRAEDFGKGLEDYIRENPVRAVAYAAGAGVLIALLFFRK